MANKTKLFFCFVIRLIFFRAFSDKHNFCWWVSEIAVCFYSLHLNGQRCHFQTMPLPVQLITITFFHMKHLKAVTVDWNLSLDFPSVVAFTIRKANREMNGQTNEIHWFYLIYEVTKLPLSQIWKWNFLTAINFDCFLLVKMFIDQFSGDKIFISLHIRIDSHFFKVALLSSVSVFLDKKNSMKNEELIHSRQS